MLRFPKPEPRKRARARETRGKADRRNACRAIVYARAGGCCQGCGRPLVLDPRDAPHVFAIAHVDEIVMRSKGGDPLDPDNCVLRCAACHARRHGHRVVDRTGGKL